jgi:signal transduction histidine kinase
MDLDIKGAMQPGIQSHLQYVGMTAEDVASLREVRDLVEQHSDAFVKSFYDHLLAFEETRAFLTDEGKVQRLLRGQRNYLLTLFDAKFDAAYYDFRRAIGQTHFRIGLGFRWYIGAYVLYLDFFMPLFQQHFADDVDRMRRVTSAFRKATLLDMSIVLEAYHEGDMAALEQSKAQVMHQEKLAAVGLLASGLAHEIGNPLASIQAVCDNQLRKKPDPQVAEKFQRIRDQVVRITAIVRQLVGHARPTQAAWQEVALEDTVQSALAIAKLSRSSKTVQVEVKLDDGLPRPWGIPDQLSQVFLNLFLNAFDAMPESGGTLAISSSGQGKRVEIAIRDNGSGIPEGEMSKLFTPFFTTKDVGKGTGLGLHVCEGIMRRHGGEIRVESSPRGSTFTVVLPLADGPPAGAE